LGGGKSATVSQKVKRGKKNRQEGCRKIDAGELLDYVTSQSEGGNYEPLQTKRRFYSGGEDNETQLWPSKTETKKKKTDWVLARHYKSNNLKQSQGMLGRQCYGKKVPAKKGRLNCLNVPGINFNRPPEFKVRKDKKPDKINWVRGLVKTGIHKLWIGQCP